MNACLTRSRQRSAGWSWLCGIGEGWASQEDDCCWSFTVEFRRILWTEKTTYYSSRYTYARLFWQNILEKPTEWQIDIWSLLLCWISLTVNEWCVAFCRVGHVIHSARHQITHNFLEMVRNKCLYVWVKDTWSIILKLGCCQCRFSFTGEPLHL